MLEYLPPELEDYCRLHSDGEPQIYRRLTEETYATQEMPQMLSGRMVGNLLQLLVRLTKASRILEIGMFTGYGTLKLAEAIEAGGTVCTCEVNGDFILLARRYFDEAPWGNRIQILEGPALKSLRSLDPYFDLVFIDADKTNYLKYYQKALELVRPAGVIVLDNALWSSRVLNPEDEASQAIAKMNDFVQRDERVHNVLLPIRDGLMVAYRK